MNEGIRWIPELEAADEADGFSEEWIATTKRMITRGFERFCRKRRGQCFTHTMRRQIDGTARENIAKRK